MNPIQVKKIKTLTGHNDSVYNITKYNHHQFFSAAGDGMVVLWDLKDPETGQLIVKVPNSVYAISYQQDRDLLVVAQNYSGVHLIDVESKKEIKSLALTEKPIYSVETTENVILIGTGEGRLHVLDWGLNVLRSINLSPQNIRSIAVNSKQNEVAVGSSDQMIRILDLENFVIKHEFLAHENSVFAVKFHDELPVLLSTGRDAKIKVWDLDNKYSEVEKIAAHMYAVHDLANAPSGNYFASSSMDKTLKIWDAQRMKLLKVIDKARHGGHTSSVNKLLWMEYNNWLVSCSDDRTISIWEIDFGN
mgnify:CR=1 FL=1